MLKFTSENESATLNLAASLPSLRFHIDEEKVTENRVLISRRTLFGLSQVYTLISCLQAVKTNSETIMKPAVPIIDHFQSVKPHWNKQTSIGVSMYHSAVDSLFGSTDSRSFNEFKSHSGTNGAYRFIPNLKEKLLIAKEKQISAKLSIAEVMLSLSSRGVCCGGGGEGGERVCVGMVCVLGCGGRGCVCGGRRVWVGVLGCVEG